MCACERASVRVGACVRVFVWVGQMRFRIVWVDLILECIALMVTRGQA